MSGFANPRRYGGATRAQSMHAVAVFPLGTIFEPDLLMASQWRDRHGGGHLRSPEQALCLAILEQAVGDYRMPVHLLEDRPSAARHYADARAWLLSDAAADLFAFLNVCLQLGLEPDRVRAGLGLSAGGGGQTLESVDSSSSERRRGRPNVTHPRTMGVTA